MDCKYKNGNTCNINKSLCIGVGECRMLCWSEDFWEKNKKQEIAELKAENEKLIEGLGIANKYVNKYHQTLQEIKAIAETPKPFKDFSETKTATEVEYDYAAICNELELRLHKVLMLITKAEEE